MASLYRRSNGSYYASFYDDERRPKQKRVSLHTKDKTTARQLLTKWERLWLTGEADPWTDDLHAAVKPKPEAEGVTLKEAFAAFVRSRKDMRCTPETLRTYRETVGKLIEEVGRGSL